VSRSYWTTRTAAVTREIERAGWRVVRKRLPEDVVGSCDYDKRTLYLDAPDAREEFVTLCHEDGHRRAFIMHGSRNEAAFRRHCRLRQFRELQACVLGWETCRRHTARVPLREWMKFNEVSAIEAIRHDGRT
jgi:hypothetical protein